MLKLDVEVQTVDLFSGEHYQEWYTAINPKKKVPGKLIKWFHFLKRCFEPNFEALQLDDGTVITESAVIAQYFCKLSQTDLYPGENLISKSHATWSTLKPRF